MKNTAHEEARAKLKTSQVRQRLIVRKFLDDGGNTEMARIEMSILK